MNVSHLLGYLRVKKDNNRTTVPDKIKVDNVDSNQILCFCCEIYISLYLRFCSFISRFLIYQCRYADNIKLLQ